MRFILNCNVSPKVAEDLRRLGHEVEVAEPGTSDEAILARATRLGTIVVTCDEDFGQLVFEKGLPNAGIVKLTLRNNSAANQVTALRNALNKGQIAPGAFVKLDDADLR